MRPAHLPLWAACVLALNTGFARAQDDDAARASRELDSEPKPTQIDRELPPEELQKLLARYAHEPSVARVVEAARRARERNPARFAALASRARLRGLLPDVDLGARRGQGIDLFSSSAELRTADDLTLFATLRFDLGRLVFAQEEIGIARERRFAELADQQLLKQVVHLYFLRRRLLLERDLRGTSDLTQELRIAEAEALLDAFTDGAFKRMIREADATWTSASTPASEPR